METIVGVLKSKSSNKEYRVKWISDNCSVWIEMGDGWQQVCKDVKNKDGALDCARIYIDGEPDIY